MCKRKFYQPMLFVILLVLVLASSSTLASSPPVDKDASSHNYTTASASVNVATGGIRINEVMFYPSAGGYEWVELKNTGSTPISIGGYGVTDEDGNWYRIPDNLPPVPSGAFVVIVFDGAGSAGDDYDFSDNVATLHTPPGLVNIFEDSADQCALYTHVPGLLLYLPLLMKNFESWNPPVPQPPSDFPAPSIVSFVAWGADPGADAANAIQAGLWGQGWFKSLARGLGVDSGSRIPNETIGLLPGSQTNTVDDWTLYLASQTTKGSENAWPLISWYYPPAGATIDSATFAVSWNPVEGATGYRFQMDNDSDFSSPLVDLTLQEARYIPSAPVPEGTYYWRVKVIFVGGESLWSSGVEIHSLTLPYGSSTSVRTLASKTLGITWQLQHKDTNMLCLDGDPETGNFAWDRPHTSRGIHGNMYCARASIAMMASYYGGRLSQDRISYEIFKGGEPEGDLGHNVGVTLGQIDTAVSWALGTNIARQDGKPTFQQIKNWIDANQPIGSVIPGHMRVIDGYWEFSLGPVNFQFIHILDPWDRAKWVNYADDNIIHVWVGPAGAGGAPNVRSDEDVDGDGIADTMDDSDGDGICDFDERNRFNLDPGDPDTDDDLVPDKLDMREYLFTNTGAYSRRNPDIDGDGLRKEGDPDNDYAQNNGLIDGCEDSNQNGKFEANLGETDNFKPSDDMNLHIQLTWPKLGADVDLHLIRPNGQMWSYNDCYFANMNPDWGMPGVSCDDPRLDIDCITQCTVENIRLSRLENGIYSVKVHYYWDHNLGPTSPRVTVWVQGVRYDFGPQTLTDDQVWDVCTIEWPSKRVTPGGLVTSLSGTERLTRPKEVEEATTFKSRCWQKCSDTSANTRWSAE